MTIDERIEALTQSLELTAAVQRDSGTRLQGQIAELTRNVNQMSAKVEQAADSAKQGADSVKQMSEAILVTSVRQNLQENEIDDHKKRLVEMGLFRFRTERDLAKTAPNLAEITDKLNGLIAVVDGIIRDRKGNGPAAPQ